MSRSRTRSEDEESGSNSNTRPNSASSNARPSSRDVHTRPSSRDFSTRPSTKGSSNDEGDQAPAIAKSFSYLFGLSSKQGESDKGSNSIKRTSSILSHNSDSSTRDRGSRRLGMFGSLGLSFMGAIAQEEDEEEEEEEEEQVLIADLDTLEEKRRELELRLLRASQNNRQKFWSDRRKYFRSMPLPSLASSDVDNGKGKSTRGNSAQVGVAATTAQSVVSPLKRLVDFRATHSEQEIKTAEMLLYTQHVRREEYTKSRTVKTTSGEMRVPKPKPPMTPEEEAAYRYSLKGFDQWGRRIIKKKNVNTF